MADILATYDQLVRLETATRLIAETRDKARIAAHEQQIADLRAALPELTEEMHWSFRKFATHQIEMKRIQSAIAKNEQTMQEEIAKAEEAKKSIARKYTAQRAAKEMAALDEPEAVVRIRSLNSDLRKQMETAELAITPLRNIIYGMLQAADNHSRIADWKAFEFKTTMPLCIEECLAMRRAEIEPHMIVVGEEELEPVEDMAYDINGDPVLSVTEEPLPLREWASIKKIQEIRPQVKQEVAPEPVLVKRDRSMLPGETRGQWMGRMLFPKVSAKIVSNNS